MIIIIIIISVINIIIIIIILLLSWVSSDGRETLISETRRMQPCSPYLLVVLLIYLRRLSAHLSRSEKPWIFLRLSE